MYNKNTTHQTLVAVEREREREREPYFIQSKINLIINKETVCKYGLLNILKNKKDDRIFENQKFYRLFCV